MQHAAYSIEHSNQHTYCNHVSRVRGRDRTCARTLLCGVLVWCVILLLDAVAVLDKSWVLLLAGLSLLLRLLIAVLVLVCCLSGNFWVSFVALLVHQTCAPGQSGDPEDHKRVHGALEKGLDEAYQEHLHQRATCEPSSYAPCGLT